MKIDTKSKIAKIALGILAIVSIGIVAYIALPAIWFWIGYEVGSALLVAVGCSGEWFLHHHPAGKKKVEKEEHHRMESGFIGAVVVGVCMELLFLGHVIPEAIEMQNEVSSANERASTNELQVALRNVIDPRAQRTSGELNKVLTEAGWKVVNNSQIDDFGEEGILIFDGNIASDAITEMETGKVGTSEKAAHLLLKLLTERNVPAKISLTPPTMGLPTNTIFVAVGLRPNKLKADWMEAEAIEVDLEDQYNEINRKELEAYNKHDTQMDQMLVLQRIQIGRKQMEATEKASDLMARVMSMDMGTNGTHPGINVFGGTIPPPLP